MAAVEVSSASPEVISLADKISSSSASKCSWSQETTLKTLVDGVQTEVIVYEKFVKSIQETLKKITGTTAAPDNLTTESASAYAAYDMAYA